MASLERRQIAILGGSFNPPHVGHQCLCLLLLECCEVDQVWVVPTHRHYFGKELSPFADRVQLCERLIAPFGKRAQVCEIEAQLDTPSSRMFDTLTALQTLHPDVGFRLVIGADILEERDRWYRFDDVAKLAPPIVFQRHGYAGGDLPAPPEVSSSELREKLQRNESAVPFVPIAVQEYIDNTGMYDD